MLILSACSLLSFPDARDRDCNPAASLVKGSWIALIAAVAGLSAPSAIAGPNCFFRAVGTLSLNFGTLDPSVGTTAVATLTVGTFNSDQLGNCTPTSQTMTLSAGNGQNFSGSSRRLASVGNFIAYSIGGAGGGWAGTGPWTIAKPGNNTWRTIPPLTATILGVDYQNAAAGNYSDSVTLTISP